MRLRRFPGQKKRHALLAAALGLLLCVPAVLTAYVNLTDAAGMTLLGMIRIPKLEEFEKAYLTEKLARGTLGQTVLDKLWTVLTGGVFQVLRHENIDSGLFTPNGMLALFTVSLPLMTLGALALLAV